METRRATGYNGWELPMCESEPDRSRIASGASGLSAFQAERLARLRVLFPEAFTEGRVDWERLRAALGDGVEEGLETYSFRWAGKRDAIRSLQASNLRPSPGIIEPSRTSLTLAEEESVDCDSTQHFFVEGDNLEVLKLLYEPYSGRVKMIYIDPPYNTGNDFIYPDNYADSMASYLRLTGQKDAEGNWLTTTPETSGRYHSAWLSMMYPRLCLARQLLREDGAICVSIGDEEVANLRVLMNEVFGEENYRNTIIVRRRDKNINRQFMERGLVTLNVGAEYVLVYARSAAFTMGPIFREATERRKRRGYWKGFWNAASRPTMRYDLLGVTPSSGQWKWKKEIAFEAVRNYEEYREKFATHISLEEHWDQSGRTLKFIRRNRNGTGKNEGVEHWIPPSAGILRSSNWTDLLASGTLSDLSLDFDNPKNMALIKDLIRMCCHQDGIVLDFFAGSCTTAHAVLDLNREDGGKRQFIMVQLPEPTGDSEFATIADIGKERIRRAIAKLRGEDGGAKGEDLGFKVFKVRTE